MPISVRPFDVAELLQGARRAIEREPNIRDKVSFRQYPAIIEHVQSCSPVDTDALRVLALIAYGWMPTALDSSEEENAFKAAQILQRVKSEDCGLTDIELEILRCVINNSFIGTSKLLHFMRPDIYPIWDSRVARALCVKGSPNVLAKYKNYMDRMSASIRADKASTREAVKWCSELHHGYKVTPVRAIELCLHLTDLGAKRERKGSR